MTGKSFFCYLDLAFIETITVYSKFFINNNDCKITL